MALLKHKELDDVVETWVAAAFSDAQRTQASHPRAAKLLLKAFAHAPQPFLSAFMHALNRTLIVFTREPAVERLVLFVARFAADHTASTGNFCSVILAYLVEHSNARSPAVRFRCMQILAAALAALPEDAEVAEEVWEPLLAAALARALDRVPRVRAVAAATLCRMQSTSDPEEDPAAARLVAMLASDSSAAVRKAAMHAVAVSDHTLPYVLQRTRDVSDDVRKAAYETLAAKLNPICLALDDRLALLRAGLKDRSDVVRGTCKRRLLEEGWLEGACDGNIFTLVELLGCQEREEDVLMALRCIFESPRQNGLLDAVEVDVNNLTSSDILVLRSLSDTQRGDAFMEKYIPSTLVYSEVLKYYAVDEFASCHLLQLCKSIDMSDESGRRSLENVVRSEFLASRQVSELAIPSAVRAMRHAMLEDEATSRILLEIVNHDVLQTSAGEIDGEGDVATVGKDAEKREWQQLRALNICLEVLRLSRQGENSSCASNALCLNFVEIAVLPQLMTVDVHRRRMAMECLGLFCLLDRSGAEAKTNLPLFIQASKNDVPVIQELAVQVVIDFLMLFDFTEQGNSENAADGARATANASVTQTEYGDCDDDESYASDERPEDNERRIKKEQMENSISSMAEDCVTMISQNMTHADGTMRTLAAQGLARLLFVRRISPNAALLARMLIVHHNPTTEDDDLLRQCLSVFFPAFAMSSPQNRLGLEGAFMQTCRLLLIAPSSSPLSTISVVQLAQFILHLTNPSMAQKKCIHKSSGSDGLPADLIHERLAEAILNEMIDALENDELDVSRIYGRILSSFRLTLSSENADQLHLLRKLAQTAINESDDKRLVTVLKKFRSRMEKLLNDVQDQELDAEEFQSRGQECEREANEVVENDEGSVEDAERAEQAEGQLVEDTLTEISDVSDRFSTFMSSRGNAVSKETTDELRTEECLETENLKMHRNHPRRSRRSRRLPASNR